MATPRIFISSTYYDLKTVRSDMERFIESLGYEPVLNEKGHIPYGNDKRLEDYCYKEIGSCDIIVSIIGGRYGASSSHENASISQMELKTAIDLGKQVYVFIDRSVKNEHRFFVKNREVQNLQFTSVDNKKVFDYLDYVESIPLNNATFGFDIANDIIEILREQWAGTFKSFLQDNAKKLETQYINDIKETAQTLKQLVGFLTEDKKNTNTAIHMILSVNHPIFNRLKKLLLVQYRLYFSSKSELDSWLKVRQYSPIDKVLWDDANYAEYINSEDKKEDKILRIHTNLFDANLNLINISPEKWQESSVQLVKSKKEIKKVNESPL